MKIRSFILIPLALTLMLILIITPTACKKQTAAEKAAKAEQAETKTAKELSEEAAQRESQQQQKAEQLADQNEKSTTQTPNIAQIAVIETNKGVIKFGFFPDKAPKTVENFIKLANDGFFNGIKWHRVVTGFVIQGGDPLSKDADPNNDGTGGPGYTIDDEFNDLKHLRGTVAMAHTQNPNSAGSQFYICLGPQPTLDGKYAIFGQVIEGMDVVDKIQIGDLMNKVTIVAGQ